MATLSLVVGIVLALMRRTCALLPVAAIIVVLYVPWFAATRTSFLYYMTPVAPFMAILVAARLSVFAGGVVPRRGWIAVGRHGAGDGAAVGAHRHRSGLAVLDAAAARRRLARLDRRRHRLPSSR